MVRKFAMVLPVCLMLSSSPVAPAHGALSWFSRANCDVALPFIPWIGAHMNESVAWNQLDGMDHWLTTATVHNKNGFALQDGSNWDEMHYEIDDWRYTWRSYAGDVHFLTGQYVHGVHYWYDPWQGFTVFLGYTFATNCNITQW